jgi:hypothetical protein
MFQTSNASEIDRRQRGAMTGPAIEDRLRRLHEHYIERVNLALDENREDLVVELQESYTNKALAIILSEASTA